MRSRHVTGVFLFSTLPLMAACSDGRTGPFTASVASTSTVVSGMEANIAIDIPEGRVWVSLHGSLPPGWPPPFPVPPGAAPAGSGLLNGSPAAAMVAAYTAPGLPREAYDFYVEGGVPPIESHSSVGVDDGFVGSVKTGGFTPGRITVMPSEGRTLIVVVWLSSGYTGPGG